MERLTFETADGLRLEGEIRQPDRATRGSAVICHPHPLKGGSKDHPLLWAIRIALVRRGFAVLSFNFRGVMGSQGSFGEGLMEVRDTLAAIDRIRREAEGPTLVVGWSFGASVALRSSLEDDRVNAAALIALPLDAALEDVPSIPPVEELERFERPVLLLVGDADPYCPVPELRRIGARLPKAVITIFKGADHYFGGRERDAAEAVGGFAERALFQGRGG